MKTPPSKETIQKSINAAHMKVSIKQQDSEDNQRFFAASYVPTKGVTSDEEHIPYVYRIVTLYGQSDGFEVFAVVNSFEGETYEADGWTVTTVSDNRGYFSGNVDEIVTLGDEKFIIAHIDKGALPSEDECLARLLEGIHKNKLQSAEDKDNRRTRQQLMALLENWSNAKLGYNKISKI